MYNTEMLLERLTVINDRCKRLEVDGCTGPCVIAEADRCALQFAVDEIERLRDQLRAGIGGCKILSQGDSCSCGLCKRDKKIELLQAIVTNYRKIEARLFT